MKNNIYAGHPATILRITKHTSIEWSFVLEETIEGRPGQFIMASLPMVGEIPVSISGFTSHSIASGGVTKGVTWNNLGS